MGYGGQFVQYGGRVDAVVGSPLVSEFTRDDWKRLAMAALDQAGLSEAEQREIAMLAEVPDGY